MYIKSEMLALVEQTARRFELPRIRKVHMPEPEPAPDKDAEFGMVVLEDGSAVLYYAWLSDTQRGMTTFSHSTPLQTHIA